MSDELSDEQIVARVRAGERDLFRLLVERHQRWLFALLVRSVGSHATAEDLAQEVFLRAYKGLSSFRGDAKVNTWLTRIAINTSASWFASRATREGRMTASLDFEGANHPTNDPADQTNRERLSQFRSALERLDPPFRAVVVLIGLEGKSYEEVASILQIPVGTVRSRLNSARHKLRTLMSTEEI